MQKKGFTLIELLVVISIIALLTSIVLSSLNDARKKSRDTARIRAVNETRTALQIYYNDNGAYVTGSNLSGVLSPTYIPVINTELFYRGINPTNTMCLGTPASPCVTYNLGIPLETNNSILNTDKDSVTTGAGFYGTSTNCTVSGVSPDRCYDVAP